MVIRMDSARKTLRLSAWHLSRMGKFLFPLYALLLAADVIVIGLLCLEQCERGLPVSFQAILWRPVIPVLFYVAYGLVFAGALLYFMRFSAGTKSVYTLRCLPMGARGFFCSVLLPFFIAVLLLWAVQLLAIYAGYGVYRMEIALYNLPGSVEGMSRLHNVTLPAAAWTPPANDLYLTFVRTPFLQLFYPRHPLFLMLAAAAVFLPAAGGVYLAVSFHGRHWGAIVPAVVALACGVYALSTAQGGIGAWGQTEVLMTAFALLILAGCMAYMLLAARRLVRRSDLG